MKQVLAASVLILSSLMAGEAALDVRRPPTPAEREALAANWSESRDNIESALKMAYLPGGMGRSGSTGNASYRAWLGLWKWADLLSRSSQAEATKLFSRHLYVEAGEDKPIFVGPGLVAPEAGVGDAAKASDKTSDASFF